MQPAGTTPPRPTLTKSELIARIIKAQPELDAGAVEEAVGSLLAHMQKALIAGERVEIRGFGSLSLRYRPPRRARNPKSGEVVEVGETFVPHFKPGGKLRARVDRAHKRERGAK